MRDPRRCAWQVFLATLLGLALGAAAAILGFVAGWVDGLRP